MPQPAPTSTTHNSPHVHAPPRGRGPLRPPRGARPPRATPWPSEMLPPATTVTVGLRQWAGDNSPYHARKVLVVAYITKPNMGGVKH
jgi:hypothetical protein